MDTIFDVDGTLLNIAHRVPLIRPPNGTKKDWVAFRAAAHRDTPIAPIIAVCRAMHSEGHRIIICTGRMREEKAVTLDMLQAAGVHWHDMFMRANGDFRPDHEVKEEMLVEMRQWGYNPILAFDDRQQVVDMWRRLGLHCAQVAKGDF